MNFVGSFLGVSANADETVNSFSFGHRRHEAKNGWSLVERNWLFPPKEDEAELQVLDAEPQRLVESANSLGWSSPAYLVTMVA